MIGGKMAQNFIANLLRRNKNEEELPYITPIQLDENGKIDPVKSANLELRLRQASTPLTTNERLFGRDMTQDYQTVNPETKKVEMATLINHKPGFFEDFGRGYRENATQGFNVNNLVPVENKGLATRLGEGLGTIERFANSPLGRGLIAYGLSNAMGDTNPIEQAFTAGVGRQNNITQDRVYRNQLKQLGMTDDEVNAIPGNVTKDVFEGVTSGMRLGSQRMTYGQLAMLDDGIAEEVRKNPALANMLVPINIARDIYAKKRPMAESKMEETKAKTEQTKAKTEETKAKTEKTKAETKQVGKPKVTISERRGGTTSTVNIIHSSGSGKGSGTPNRPTQANYVKMQAPNGKIYNVPRSRMREYIKAGGKVVG